MTTYMQTQPKIPWRTLIQHHLHTKQNLLDQRAAIEHSLQYHEDVRHARTRIEAITLKFKEIQDTLDALHAERDGLELMLNQKSAQLEEIDRAIAACDSSIHYINSAPKDPNDKEDDTLPDNGAKEELPYPTLAHLKEAMKLGGGDQIMHQVFARLLEVHGEWKTPEQLASKDNSVIVAEIKQKLVPQYEKMKSARTLNTEWKSYNEGSYRRALKFLVGAKLVLMKKEGSAVLYLLDLTSKQVRSFIDAYYKDTLGNLLVARLVDSHKDLLPKFPADAERQAVQTMLEERCTGMYAKASAATEVTPAELLLRQRDRAVTLGEDSEELTPPPLM